MSRTYHRGVLSPSSEHTVVRSHGFHHLRVKEVVDETVDARSFVLDVPMPLASDFSYRAGQFCTFRVTVGSDEHLRSYSMSSAPETDADLTVTVKRVPGGVVSNWMIDHVRPGDVLELTRPAGVFCLGPSPGPEPLVALGGGSGITPLLSLTKASLTSTTRPVRLFYANHDRASVIFLDSLERLAATNPGRLDVVHHLDVESGFPDASVVGSFAAGVEHGDFYLCGPQPFMDLVQATLTEIGIPESRVFAERFGAATAPPAPSAPSAPPAPPAPADGSATKSVTIVMKGRKHRCDYVAGQTILETARRAGLKPPFSCEAGTCATCMAMVRDGSVRMRVNEALTPEEVDEGWVLTCQSLPTSRQITVEYESL